MCESEMLSGIPNWIRFLQVKPLDIEDYKSCQGVNNGENNPASFFMIFVHYWTLFLGSKVITKFVPCPILENFV